MILISVTLVTNPILVDVNLNLRIGQNLTVIDDTIDGNGTTIIDDPLV